MVLVRSGCVPAVAGSEKRDEKQKGVFHCNSPASSVSSINDCTEGSVTFGALTGGMEAFRLKKP